MRTMRRLRIFVMLMLALACISLPAFAQQPRPTEPGLAQLEAAARAYIQYAHTYFKFLNGENDLSPDAMMKTQRKLMLDMDDVFEKMQANGEGACVARAKAQFAKPGFLLDSWAKGLVEHVEDPAALWRIAQINIWGAAHPNASRDEVIEYIMTLYPPNLSPQEYVDRVNADSRVAKDAANQAFLTIGFELVDDCDASSAPPQAPQTAHVPTLSVYCTGDAHVTAVIPPTDGSNVWRVPYVSPTGKGVWNVSPGLRERQGCHFDWY